MTSAGGLVPVARRGRACRPRCCCRVRRAVCAPRPRSRPRAGSRTRSRSTWAARAPTSASCAAVCPSRRRSASVGGFPIRLPALDIHTIGAGGGSIARLDAGGALVVGPAERGRRARARRATAAAAPSRRSPTPTSCSAASTTRSTFPGLGRLDVARRARGTAARGRRRGRRGRGRRRGDGTGGARRDRRARRRPARSRAGRVRRRGAAARVRDRRRARHARGHRAAAGGCRVRRSVSLCSPAAAGGRAVATRPTATALDAALGGGRDAGACARRCRRDDRDRGRLPLRRPEPRDHRADVDDFPAEHERRNGHARPGAPVEVVAVRARARIAAPLRVDGPARRSSAARARGPAVVAEADCTVWIPDGWVAEPARARCVGGRRGLSMNATRATLQVLISRLTGVADEMGAVLRRAAYSPNIKERADCSAALFTADGTLLVQAEHIPVHLGSMPAAVRAAIDACACGLAPGRSGHRQRPVRGRHAPQRRHARRARVRRRRHAASDGPRTARTTPTSAAWHRARCRPRRPRSTRRGCALPPVLLHAGGRGDLRRRVADARGTSRRSRRAARREPSRCRRVCASSRARRRSPRSSTTANGACAPRSRRCPTARTRSPTCSTRPVARRIASRRASPVDGHGRRRRDHVRLHRHGRAASRHRQRRRSRDRQRGRVRDPVA